MSATLDGKALFDHQQLELELGSLSRQSIEKAVGGLDGVLSIDLGSRGRKIVQRGVLHAASPSQMNDKLSEIARYMDGKVHTLVVDGQQFGELRIESFKVSELRSAGALVAVDYEIVYRQLEGQQQWA